MSLEIEATDVIKVILQFCKENGLTESFNTLQKECQVSLNTVDSTEQFVADINAGRWDAVLPLIASLRIPRSKLEDLYEQVVLELIELREVDTARAMLRRTQVFQNMKSSSEKGLERYTQLEKLCGRVYFDIREVYGNVSKDKRRAQIAHALSQEVSVVPHSRLMTLIGQALKWQQGEGLLPPGTQFDLFRGQAAGSTDQQDAIPLEAGHVLKLGKGSHPETAAWSPDGAMLAVGAVDGFIEVYDPLTGKLKQDLGYQQDEQFMMHDTAVLALAFPAEGELLASGSQDGKVKVWKVLNGQCLRRFDAAHTGGVTSVTFSRDGSHLLSSSFDGTVRIHGLKSGKLLREMRGHTSFVNSAVYSADGTNVISASSDATVRVWDAKTADCLHAFRPPQQGPTEVAVNNVMLNPGAPDQLIVCNKSNTAYIMTMQGQVVKSFLSGKREGGAFVAATASRKGEYIYCLGEDGQMYCFGALNGALEEIVAAHEEGPIGLRHHPLRNMLLTYAEEGTLKLWKAPLAN